MRFRPWLRIDSTPAERLTPELLREAWAFRRSFNVSSDDPEESFRKFQGWFAPGSELITYRERDGRLAGTFGRSASVVHDGATRHVVLHLEYAYLAPHCRGHVVFPVAAVESFARALARHHVSEASIYGIGFPTSAMAVSRYARRYTCMLDPTLLAWEREALLVHLRHTPEADPSTGLVRYPMVPREGRKVPKTERGRQFLQWYEQYSPHWTEGVGMGILLHVDVASLSRGLMRAAMGR